MVGRSPPSAALHDSHVGDVTLLRASLSVLTRQDLLDKVEVLRSSLCCVDEDRGHTVRG